MVHKKPVSAKELKAIQKALKPYFDQHPRARLDMYRRDKFILRMRIIDPDFDGMTQEQRDDLIWDMLYKNLHEDLLQELSMVLLLSPREVKESMVNIDFEKPQPVTVEG
jgi:stress-induced morphogen